MVPIINITTDLDKLLVRVQFAIKICDTIKLCALHQIYILQRLEQRMLP